jgi:peptidoglycan/xylan/chitin deacetylase (PgdA/CDA1 family)
MTDEEMDLQQAQAQLPAEWRQLDLKKLLGSRKSQAAELIRQWQEAGYIESLPDTPYIYRFTDAVPTAADDEADLDEGEQIGVPVDQFTRRQAGARHLTLGDVVQQAKAYAAAAGRYLWQNLQAHAPTVQARAQSHMRGFIRRVRVRRLLPGDWAVLAVVGVLFIVLLWGIVSPGGDSTASDTPPLDLTVLAGPRLKESTVAWYAPGPDGEVFGVVDEGTSYMPRARFGQEWLQIEFDQVGLLWLRTSDITIPGADMTLLPDLQPPVVSYSAHTIAPGESVRRIAAQGGSSITLISSYNRLNDMPPPGRPLIVPRLHGEESALPATPLLIKEGRTDQPYVALTIDLEIGDTAVGQLLDTLRQHDVQITFFVLAPWVEQHPDLARRMVAEGHELASHSLTHADFRTLSNEQIVDELAETERIVQEVTGSTTRPYFRPPYGAYDDRVLLTVIEQGYLPVYWSADSQDSRGAAKSPDFLVHQLTETIPPEELPGKIILAHCCNAHHTIVEALPVILERFAHMGIEVRTLSEVLGQ